MSRLQIDPSDCPFCPMFKYNDATYINIKPLNPVVPGHRLFIPRFHTDDISDSPESASIAFMAAAEYCGIERLDEDFNIITSLGSDATQTVGHTHIHVIPRTADDGLKLPWTDQDNT